MYGMTLEINQRCNLHCSYCYLKNKNGQRMELDTAKKCVDLAFENARVQKQEKIIFDFVGGEALLDFDLLVEIVEYIEQISKEKNYEVQYGLTTNGTIFNDEIVDWLIDKKFNLKLSIDGDRKVTNLGRGSDTFFDVYEKIQSNWNFVLKYQKNSGKFAQVTNVITNNNYMFYFESFKHLIDQFQAKVIYTVFDIDSEWKEEQLANIADQIEQAYLFFKDRLVKYPFYWHFITEVKNSIKIKKRFYSCGSGIIYLYVKSDGDFYACANAIQSKSILGNINNGYNQTKIDLLKNLSGIDNPECISCEQYDCCAAKGCIYKSLSENGSIHKPSRILCWQQKFYAEFYHKHKEFIDCLYIE